MIISYVKVQIRINNDQSIINFKLTTESELLDSGNPFLALAVKSRELRRPARVLLRDPRLKRFLLALPVLLVPLYSTEFIHNKSTFDFLRESV